MYTDGSLIPARGADPVDEFLPPPQESVLPASSLPTIQPQYHTTLLDTSVFKVAPHQVPPPTFLPETALASHQPVPHVSILPSSGASIPPQSHTSILNPDLFPSLPTPKLPNLVRPMPGKS